MLVNAASFFFVARDLDSTPRALLSAFQLETKSLLFSVRISSILPIKQIVKLLPFIED